MQKFWQRIAEVLRLSKLEKRWKKVARVVGLIVVFCTTYMLILPALTLESRTSCGFVEHSHTALCYNIDGIQTCTVPEHKHKLKCFISGLVTDGNVVTDGNIPTDTTVDAQTTQQPIEPETTEGIQTTESSTAEQTTVLTGEPTTQLTTQNLQPTTDSQAEQTVTLHIPQQPTSVQSEQSTAQQTTEKQETAASQQSVESITQSVTEETTEAPIEFYGEKFEVQTKAPVLHAATPPTSIVGTETDLATYNDTYDESDKQIKDGGGQVVSEDGTVVTTKTINGTSEENIFDITLTVRTETSVQTYLSEPDMAVVIVMDISNTMNYKIGTQADEAEPSRYSAAISAAESFIKSFYKETTGISKIGFVAFNTHAHEIFPLSPCSTESQANALISDMKTKTSNIIKKSGYASSNTRYTNIEGGLKRGNDMISAAQNQNKYIIFISDGFPTTYLKSGYTGYEPLSSSGTKGADGVFYDALTKYYCEYGTSYSDKGAVKARQEAVRIKNSGTKIFSIGVDIGTQTIERYDGRSGLSVIDRMSSTYEIGGYSDTTAFKTWLGSKIGSNSSGDDMNYYYDSTNMSELESAFAKIFESIRDINEQSQKNIWTATDPMPVHESESQVVGFIHFFDKDGNAVSAPGDPESVSGEHKLNYENTAYHEDKTIHWDLKKSGYTTETVGNTTYYYYKLKYRIRLVNDNPVFIEDHEVYETNGNAFVEYKTVVSINGVENFSDTKYASFSKPSVHGHICDLVFTKKNSMSTPLPGAEFTLTHDDANCTECHGDGTAVNNNTAHDENYKINHIDHSIGPYVKKADENGIVSFDFIPSGHKYILEETKVPESYLTNGSTYNVVAAYDVLTVTETLADGTEKVWGNDDYVIYNYSHVLPETGGSGTHCLYITGALLITLSAVFFPLTYGKDRGRRRKSSKA